MGTYMDKLKPKQWWQSIDSLVIDENSATMLNSNVYIYEQSYSYNTFFTKYFQFTQNDDNQYFWLATESNNLLNDTYDSFQINEFAWQNSLKTTGGIDRYYDPLIWRHSSDSLVVEIQSFTRAIADYFTVYHRKCTFIKPNDRMSYLIYLQVLLFNQKISILNLKVQIF